MLSWLKSSSSASTEAPSPTPAVSQQEAAAVFSPVVEELEAPIVASPPNSASPQLTPAPAPSPPRPGRKEVNPNAPYVILACAGTAVSVGVLIGLRRVRQLQAKTLELSAAAAAAEAAEGGSAVSGTAGPIISGARPGRTSSILTKGSLAGVQATPSQAPAGGGSSNPFAFAAAAVKGPEGAVSGAPSSTPLSAATASLLRKPAAGPGSSTAPAARAPLFPPSSARAAESASPTMQPSSPTSASGQPRVAPKATLRSLIKEGRKKDVDESEELPPMTTAVMLRALAAFGIATGMAVFLVGGPFAAVCWWLGVEEPADFTPMFRRKIVTLFPSLEKGLLREEAEAAAAASSTAMPSAASSSSPATSPSSSAAKLSLADYLPDFLRHTPSDKDVRADATPSSYIPSILHQGAAPEGEEEHSVYAWFEGVKQEFERDRLEEVRKRAEDERFYREWEEKLRREGR